MIDQFIDWLTVFILNANAIKCLHSLPFMFLHFEATCHKFTFIRARNNSIQVGLLIDLDKRKF